MAKDPAFLFYSQDFFMGVQLMGFEDRGKYITLLCLMHQHGRLSEERVGFFLGSVSVMLRSKFQIDENGLWFSERLEREIVKRSNFINKQRENGSKGGRPKKPNETHGLTQTQTQSKSQTKPIIEDENLNENRIEDESEKEIVVLPWGTREFQTAWDKWIDYKKSEHRFTYKTVETEQATLNKLWEETSGDESLAIETIRKCISATWKGLFVDKIKSNGKPKYSREKFEQAGRELYPNG